MIEGLNIYELVNSEMIQRKQEGYIVPDFDIENADETGLKEIYEKLLQTERDKNFPFYEPEKLDDILAASDGCTYKAEPDSAAIKKQFHGAWLGRTIGCLIGKPVETYPYGGGDDKYKGWEYIKIWQKGAGDDFPPTDYISGFSTAAEEYGIHVGSEPSHRENITFAQSDDDIRYLVLALLINEKYGNDFTANEVCDMWQHYLTPSMCFTAEHAALINGLTCPEKDAAKKIEYCHTHNNPYREWIGAQIRIDHYGYFNAGDPLTAAKTAFNDADFSHIKNGVYGAMFFAALIAAAFTEKDIKKCIEIALGVIPKKSRLYADILFAVELAEKTTDIEEIYKALWDRFSDLHVVHTNNNAAVCVAALLLGKGDFVKSVSIAVGAGWDTDCNGATVGSIVGAMHGESCIPDYLKTPLNDTLYSSIPDFHPIKISECAERTYNAFINK